jgi:hypothetical protein
MAHDHIQPGSLAPVIMTVSAVLIAIRVSFFVFLPRQVQGDILVILITYETQPNFKQLFRFFKICV